MSKRAEQAGLIAYPVNNIKVHQGYNGDFVDYDKNNEKRKLFVEGYNQAQQDTIESACQILYDWNKQMTEMFGVKAVLSCNQFTVDVDRFRKLLELERT